ncbi:MAG TPA: cupin domain-containing protein [Aquificales bacterium]|nr:cupin domain-containing protein [Aquificales bacterium]
MGLVKKTGITDRNEVFEILQKEGYKDIYVWRDPPGAFYDWHTHTYDEIRWVLRGKILIGTEEGEYLLEAGDVMVVPAGTRHWAKVGEEGVEYVCASRY